MAPRPTMAAAALTTLIMLLACTLSTSAINSNGNSNSSERESKSGIQRGPLWYDTETLFAQLQRTLLASKHAGDGTDTAQNNDSDTGDAKDSSGIDSGSGSEAQTRTNAAAEGAPSTSSAESQRAFVFAYGGALLRARQTAPNHNKDSSSRSSSSSSDPDVDAAIAAGEAFLQQKGVPDCAPAGSHAADLVFTDDGRTPYSDGAQADATPSGGVPSLGAWYLLRFNCRAAGSGTAAHTLVVTRGVARDFVVTAHTTSASTAVQDLAPAGQGDASAAAGSPLRVMSYNVWNTNPPKWLHRDGRDRWRQYAFRLYHLADVVRAAAPDIIAFQEVRYDSTLGGYTPSSSRSNYNFERALWMAGDWYNKTRAFASTAKYESRNAAKWARVTSAADYALYGAAHPVEGSSTGNHTAMNAHADVMTIDAGGDTSRSAIVPGASPFTKPIGPGPESYKALRDALTAKPHAQVAHLAAHLPGYNYVFQPGQIYVDKSLWVHKPHRDEEGPAIFSRHRIVRSDYLLLSRDAHDEGDGHQRVCLHALIALPEASGAHVLVDVYTIHFALSEAARNRTVLEVLQFVRDSASGALQILMGDMNAEPHEPAMAAIRDAGLLLHSDLEPTVGLLTRAGSASQPPHDLSGTVARPLPSLSDVWLQHFPEPVPRTDDAAARRYAFTFPCDDPVKRIDLMFVGTAAAPGAGGLGAGICRASNSSTNHARVAAQQVHAPPCVQVDRVWLAGQDPLPLTEVHEGNGRGMVSDRSPVFASDHRALVADLQIITVE